MLLHGNTKANLENLSMTVSRYLILVKEGKGSLKSILNRSMGWVALINLVSGGLQNLDVILLQILQSLTILRTSFNKNGKFLDLIK